MIIAGTGHRPTYLAGQYDESHPWQVALIERLDQYIIEKQPSVIISGMAIGWDTFLAEAAIRHNVELHCYIPFKNQGSKWPTKTKKRYQGILDLSDEIIYTAEEYSNKAFFIRDEAMIDNCDEVVALLNPEITKGGTFYTVKYAEKHDKPVTNLWEE